MPRGDDSRRAPTYSLMKQGRQMGRLSSPLVFRCIIVRFGCGEQEHGDRIGRSRYRRGQGTIAAKMSNVRYGL
jgi:hypothetical protein